MLGIFDPFSRPIFYKLNKQWSSAPTPPLLSLSLSLLLSHSRQTRRSLPPFLFVARAFENDAPQLLTNMSQVAMDSVVKFENVVHKHGLITTSSGLRFEALPHHFVDGRMTVKCMSNLSLKKPDYPYQQNAPTLDSKETMMYSEYRFLYFNLFSITLLQQIYCCFFKLIIKKCIHG